MGSRGQRSASAKSASNPFEIKSNVPEGEAYTDSSRIFLYKNGKPFWDMPKTGFKVSAEAESMMDLFGFGETKKVLDNWPTGNGNDVRRVIATVKDKRFAEYFINKGEGKKDKKWREQLINDIANYRW